MVPRLRPTRYSSGCWRNCSALVRTSWASCSAARGLSSQICSMIANRSFSARGRQINLCTYFSLAPALLQARQLGIDVLHYLVVLDARPWIVNGLLNLLFQPFAVGCCFVRLLHRCGLIRPGAGGLQAVGVVVGGIDIEAGDAHAFEVANERFKLAPDTHLVAALRGQGALGHPVLDEDAPAASLADNVRAAHGPSFNQPGKRRVVDGFSAHNVLYFMLKNRRTSSSRAMMETMVMDER